MAEPSEFPTQSKHDRPELKGLDRPRGGNGKFVARADTAERDAEAVRLRTRGMTLQKISDALGFSGPPAVHAAIKRAFARTSNGVVRDYQTDRAMQASRLDTAIEAAYKAMDAFVPMTDSRGNVLIDPETGQPFRDYSVVLAAIDKLVKVEARRAALCRLDEVKPQEGVGDSDVDGEFASLVAQLDPGAEGKASS